MVAMVLRPLLLPMEMFMAGRVLSLLLHLRLGGLEGCKGTQAASHCCTQYSAHHWEKQPVADLLASYSRSAAFHVLCQNAV